MYELLLQAEKALADGLLVQAEQTYWQLIELDSANAIALAGLAQISLERGDERLARRFADRAMAIDPENVVAGRVVDALEHKGAEDEAKAPELPLAAARRLEALSKRRGAASPEPAEGAGSPPEAAADGSKTKHRHRRKAGRQAATPPPEHRNATHHEPHHAMPFGKRRFGADELRAPTPDAYAAAEAAAAVEAVDALDVVEEPPKEVPGPVSGEADDPGTVDATEPEESVVVPVALVADAAEREAAELEASWALDGNARWTRHVAEANAVAEADAVVEANEAVETDTAEPPVDEPVTRDPAPVDSIDERPQVAELCPDEFEAAEFEAAEAEAAHLAPKELLEEQSSEPGDLVDLEAPSRQSFAEVAEELSEKEAETQALREALAIVLGNESQAGSVEPWGGPDPALPAVTPAERADESAAQGELAGPAEAAEAAAPDQLTPETEPEPAPRRRNGLFRRFGGS